MKTLDYIKSTLLLLVMFIAGYFIGRLTKAKEITYIPRVTEHYITDVVFDTVSFLRYDTIYLNSVQSDTVIKYDTIENTIILPISNYTIDTTILDSHYTTQFKASISGYNVKMDNLYLKTEINAPHPVKIAQKGKNRFGIGVGVMVNKDFQFGLGVGVMYQLF